jgi:hypothetical protein
MKAAFVSEHSSKKNVQRSSMRFLLKRYENSHTELPSVNPNVKQTKHRRRTGGRIGIEYTFADSNAITATNTGTLGVPMNGTITGGSIVARPW